MFYMKKNILTVFFICLLMPTGKLQAFSFYNLWSKIQKKPFETALTVTAIITGIWIIHSYFSSKTIKQKPLRNNPNQKNSSSSDDSLASICKDMRQYIKDPKTVLPITNNDQQLSSHEQNNQTNESIDWKTTSLQIHNTQIPLKYRKGNGLFFISMTLRNKEYGLFNSDLFVLACDMATYIQSYGLLGRIESAEIETILQNLFKTHN